MIVYEKVLHPKYILVVYHNGHFLLTQHYSEHLFVTLAWEHSLVWKSKLSVKESTLNLELLNLAEKISVFLPSSPIEI